MSFSSLMALYKSFNFSSSLALTSQIYDRKIDVFIGDILKSIAISTHKTTNDLRLLQHLKEIEETQIEWI